MLCALRHSNDRSANTNPEKTLAFVLFPAAVDDAESMGEFVVK